MRYKPGVWSYTGRCGDTRFAYGCRFCSKVRRSFSVAAHALYAMGRHERRCPSR